MSTPGPTTLRRRLAMVTAGVFALALTAGAVLLVQLVTSQRVDALDDAVTTRVLTVRDLLVADRLPDTLAVGAPGEVVQLLDAGGSVLATSTTGSMTLPVVAADVVAAADADDAPVVVDADSPYAGASRVAVLRVPPSELPGQWREVATDGVAVVAVVPLADVVQTGRTLSLLLTGVVPVLVLGLAVAVWVVLGRALRPVEDLRAAAAEVVSAGGPGSLPVPRTGELAALAQTLNAMLDRLDAAATAERAAASAARAAAERQRTFVADAAHELRSPLASLLTSLEVAARHPASYPSDELVTDLAADAARLQTLVEDLLLLARVGARVLRPRELDLREVVTGVAGTLPTTGPTVRIEGEGGAHGDQDAVDRVIRNLLENARRHAAGEVLVTIAEGSVLVDDDGAGIEPAQRERVFERFVRLEESRERDAGGSGLGLAIARELAREQGGDVVLEESPLRGLRAVLSLPGPLDETNWPRSQPTTSSGPAASGSIVHLL